MNKIKIVTVIFTEIRNILEKIFFSKNQNPCYLLLYYKDIF